MESSFSISIQKEHRWSQRKGKDTLKFYEEHEKKKLKLKAYSSPEWYEVAKQLRRECSKQDVPIDKNPKQNKNKFSCLKKKWKTLKDKLRSTDFDKGEQQTKVRMKTLIQRMIMRRVIGKN